MEENKLPEIELKIMVIRILSELRSRTDKLNEHFNREVVSIKQTKKT